MLTNPEKLKRINVYTFGCAKNLVDSEKLMGALRASACIVVHESPLQKGDLVVVNTCGFINDAKQESINAILEFAEQKNTGEIDGLFVYGCLSQRYKEELLKEIPEVDNYFGINSIKEIIEKMGLSFKDHLLGERFLSTPGHYAYLKISDGCDQKCSFCAIPLIKGKHKSVPDQELITESRKLVDQGVRELILVAQDSTYYGLDLYGQRRLFKLMDSLSSIKGLEWLRLQYTYPSSFPLEILDLMNDRGNICRYLDIPLQHISDPVLKKMRRGINARKSRELIETIRTKVPEIALRTTFLVGHPGESDADFEELLDFVEEVKFDRLGVFTFSPEENTYSYGLKNVVPPGIREERAQQLMSVQQNISLERNNQKIGTTCKVLIDRKEGHYFTGRTEFDSPEVDNEVFVEDHKKLAIGSFYSVEITGAGYFDLYGKALG